MLPALTVGQYYTGPDGTGDIVAADTEITTTTTLYIYAVSGDDDTVCSDEHEFTVTINYAPVVGTATPLEACDDNNDGYAFFDLTEAGTEVIGAQTGLEVSYHETQDDADFGQNDIIDPTAYQNSEVEDFDTPEHPIAYIRIIEAGTTTNCARCRARTAPVPRSARSPRRQCAASGNAHGAKPQGSSRRHCLSRRPPGGRPLRQSRHQGMGRRRAQ